MLSIILALALFFPGWEKKRCFSLPSPPTELSPVFVLHGLCGSRSSSFSWTFSRLRWVTVPLGAAPSAVSRSLSSLYRGTNALFFFFSSSLFYLLCVIENSLICSFNNSHNVWLSVSLSSMKDTICSFIWLTKTMSPKSESLNFQYPTP